MWSRSIPTVPQLAQKWEPTACLHTERLHQNTRTRGPEIWNTAVPCQAAADPVQIVPVQAAPARILQRSAKKLAVVVVVAVRLPLDQLCMFWAEKPTERSTVTVMLTFPKRSRNTISTITPVSGKSATITKKDVSREKSRRSIIGEAVHSVGRSCCDSMIKSAV